jgi:signal recognition particle subunit SRP72
VASETEILTRKQSYRSEDFESARRIYDELWAGRTEDTESDLRINRGAVTSQLHWSRQGDVAAERATREDLEVFETAYNAACGCLARGEFAQGEMLLKRARGKPHGPTGSRTQLTAP